jgi:general secretion pathway protein H
MGKDDGEGGFTLVEMLLVVVLLALAAGLVMARASPDRSAVTLSAHLGDYLREARALAILEGRIVTLRLDPATRQLAGPPPLGELALHARLALETSQFPADSLSFQPDGSTGGGILHILPRGAAEAGYSLAVAPLTGAVTALP